MTLTRKDVAELLLLELPFKTYRKENQMAEVIIDGEKYEKQQKFGLIVLVRTYSAGVHFGVLESRNGKEVVLKDARRLWSWQGACSLNQVAMDGVDLSNSKISVKVPFITLTEAIELIPMTPNAGKSMMEAKPWKK